MAARGGPLERRGMGEDDEDVHWAASMPTTPVGHADPVPVLRVEMGGSPPINPVTMTSRSAARGPVAVWHLVASVPVAARAAVPLAALLLLIVVGACDTSARAPLVRPGLVVGIGGNTLEGGLGREQDVVRRLGVRWLREELTWDEIERVRGRRSYAAYDRMMYAAARRGMRVLPVLLGTPRWLGSRRELPPPGPWGAFVADVVERYGPGGAFWRAHPELDGKLAPVHFELWNEPWFDTFSTGGPDPAAFAAMQRAAVLAGRRANPRARYLLAAEMGYTARDGTKRNWLEDLYAADPLLNQSFDALAVHPYTFGRAPVSTEGPRASQFKRLDDALALLRARGAADRPLWLTEIGWSTCRGRPACVTERQQAAYFRQAFRLITKRYGGQVAAIFAYHLRDFGAPPDRRDFERNFGLLRGNGGTKPAWGVVRRAARDGG